MDNKRWIWMPILFALIGLAGVAYLDYLSPEPVPGEVGPVPIMTDQGVLGRTVTWTNDVGERRRQTMVIPSEYEGLSTVPVVDRPGTESFVSDGTTSPWFYVSVAAIGVLLGAVTEMTLRGYGYVRGTGEIGETPELDVAESHGFYWRT